MDLNTLIADTTTALAAAEASRTGFKQAAVERDGVTCTMSFTPGRGWRHPERTTTQFKRGGKVVAKSALVAEQVAATKSLVADAIAPLKDAAVEYAGQLAQREADRALAMLEAAGWDLEVAAPYPNSGIGRIAYRTAIEKRAVLSRLSVSTNPRGCRMPHEPDMRARSEAGVAGYVAEERAAAGASFDAYVHKMVSKIGGVDAAEVSGGHLWQGSILTVRKGETVERWHTQQIVNCSCLGKLFNQWPTRLMK